MFKDKPRSFFWLIIRPVLRVIMRPAETSWLGINKPQYVKKQSEGAVWGELMEYLKGGKVPSKRLSKPHLDQFVLADELLYYVLMVFEPRLYNMPMNYLGLDP